MQTARIIEKLSTVDDSIKKAEAGLRVLKAKRAKIEAKLLKAFAAGKIDSLRSGKQTAVRKETASPSIKDYPKFLKFVVRNQAFDLFHKRVSATALKERTENGEKVPGVEYFRRAYISIVKQR